MTTKVPHSLKNITNHSSSEAASHPSRLESLVEQYVLLWGQLKLKHNVQWLVCCIIQQTVHYARKYFMLPQLQAKICWFKRTHYNSHHIHNQHLHCNTFPVTRLISQHCYMLVFGRHPAQIAGGSSAILRFSMVFLSPARQSIHFQLDIITSTSLPIHQLWHHSIIWDGERFVKRIPFERRTTECLFCTEINSVCRIITAQLHEH